MSRVAAVDMGTNSTRLLIADVNGARGGAGDGSGLATIDRRMRITRLGQGVDAARRLHPDAIARVVAALEEFRGAIDEHGATEVRAVTTSAARDAQNAEELLDRCEAALGVRPEVIAGAEEGRLSFRGATFDIAEPAPYLVVDIGGGSTELIVGRTGPDAVISLDVGCVRLTEQLLRGDPPQPEELSNAVAYVRDLLVDAERVLPGVDRATTLVGLAGTVSTMAAIELGLAEYDRAKIHHFHLERAAVEEIFRTLATETNAQRAHNPGLDPGRVDVIVGGVLVAACIMRQWNFDEMLVSESDILDGIALEMVTPEA
jgi:exopolyphosphatase/guanosine-5'-triphosphate,3'-diphosphate pyrophosphatase